MKISLLFKTPTQIDAAIATLAVLLLFAILHAYDGFEVLYHFTRAHEDMELDEVILVCLSLPLPLAWYSYRRLKEVSRMADKTLQMERELNHSRKIESLGALAGGMAHELNNQLQPAQSIAELLVEKCDPASPDRKKLEMIEASLSRAKNTVSKVLKYAHQTDDSPSNCSVEDVLVSLDDFLQLSCPGSIRYALACDGPIGRINLSAGELENIVVNLFTNAVQAVDQNQGDISIEARKAETGEPVTAYAMICVKDNGCGIPPDLRERIFDPYFTTREVGKGTGLGLWQVNHLVHRADGEITLDSVPGSGTEICLKLPLGV